MDLELLKRLRQANQDLLQRLTTKQEEIRKRVPSKPLLPASVLCHRTAEGSVPWPRRGKENQVDADPGVVVSVEPRARTARAALSSPLKHSSRDRELQQQQAKAQEAAGLDSSYPGKEKSVIPVSAIIPCGREASRVDGDGHARGSPEKESFLLGLGENRKQSALLRGFHEKNHPDPSLSRVQNEEPSEQHVVSREPTMPKSVLVTSRAKELKKKAHHVTFQPEPEEDATPVGSWSARPFLGYDWIAGLLDTKSSVTEKSEQYFAELQQFRQANREACIDEQDLEPKALDCTVPEQEPDLITSSHKCFYCYRLNQRLFPVPVDPESACPVCKIPRAHQPPGTLEEPAHVRVSIPRNTLLPAHKYKAHRRRSFEPADDLALPSHCLAGWENIIPPSNPRLSSLDLRASLEERPSPHPHLDSLPRVSRGAEEPLPPSARPRSSSASPRRKQSRRGRRRAAPGLDQAGLTSTL
ncbi:PREDICTED: migration and invasion-inhibitory protein isoform X1 [Lepidothrix coronata]|uniref:Migration and invasion-inhibitory protein isoform X1 n=1 Tax=Lepidothrix coronata TaxID=321398 RepID=A0A6J0IL41_9PASS|nr:PREDICTED: migration and invasion-inhibitory protein isoform X1 [Lepidothrix coronata]XP_017687484.1 PREDICTED: migration and invasion-inhibitory protein isoform X1 [Lepidothrix coronata]XP_017687485.1 PREDICTED: migration and invasion-inhibitory protein isoform X1 [Lepidothrix coronata]XP_017687486.1 PREDICTED: migration and invasion-inhibitory protein isoform X1 [Lepidothrix coronata]XP_017687487.1 PREDICTED: migration and invasion-inhibitory protein isoform X1 [Lepidothrix coronata]XP_01